MFTKKNINEELFRTLKNYTKLFYQKYKKCFSVCYESRHASSMVSNQLTRNTLDLKDRFF
jgi:hypothetical protein